MNGPGAEGDERGELALALAREELRHRLAGAPAPAIPDREWLRRPAACFVTLKLGGALRGCIGSIQPRRSLGEDLCANAQAAALDDPRFPPVTAAELDRLVIEVSLLSPLAPLDALDEGELLARLRPGHDGLYLEAGPRRATFLPQVWRSLPEPAEFVARLREKAGVQPDVPAAEIRWWIFSVRSWSEGEDGRGERI